MRNGLLGGHGKRVADLARRIAVAMEVPSDQVQDIFVAGLLHDIGFMAVPDTLLAKPVGRYTPDEMQLYQRHAALGAQSLMALDDMQAVASLIRAHHERFDGKGYRQDRRQCHPWAAASWPWPTPGTTCCRGTSPEPNSQAEVRP
jgi:response regulator RpfG family c-di-GMP phosphodiesterase